jgi:phosphohistidine phosphatase
VKLLLVRHGPAEDRVAWRAFGKDDASRPLTADGRERTRAAMKGLSRLLDPPGVIATSPFVRAVETAGELARAFRAGAPEELPAMAPAGPPVGVVSWLATRRDEDLVALVGHEPQLGRLACWLLARTEEPFLAFKKCGACLLDLGERPRAGSARLVWMLAPAELRRLGR